jgi:hypothetical protein
LDGAQYDQRFLGEAGRALLAAGGEQADEQLEACTLLHNNKAAPLITSLAGCKADDAGRLVLQTQVCSSLNKRVAASGGSSIVQQPSAGQLTAASSCYWYSTGNMQHFQQQWWSSQLRHSLCFLFPVWHLLTLHCCAALLCR